MKEFELSEDHEFIDGVGIDVVPEDKEEDLYLQRDQIVDSIKTKIEEHLRNNRLIEVYLNLEFRADNDVSNFISITYHPQS
jgi:hypothetical protein